MTIYIYCMCRMEGVKHRRCIILYIGPWSDDHCSAGERPASRCEPSNGSVPHRVLAVLGTVPPQKPGRPRKHPGQKRQSSRKVSQLESQPSREVSRIEAPGSPGRVPPRSSASRPSERPGSKSRPPQEASWLERRPSSGQPIPGKCRFAF